MKKKCLIRWCKFRTVHRKYSTDQKFLISVHVNRGSNRVEPQFTARLTMQSNVDVTDVHHVQHPFLKVSALNGFV